MFKFACLIMIVFSIPALALRPGSEAPALRIREWLCGSELILPPSGTQTPQRSETGYRVIVIWGSWSPAAAASLAVLRDLRERYPRLPITVISREREEAIAGLLQQGKESGFAIAADNNDLTTSAYMTGGVMYPKSFVIDDRRLVVWSGEVIDLTDAVNDIMNGSYNLELAIRLHPSREALITALQSGDPDRVVRESDRILSGAPGDNFALRAQLFVYESRDDGAGAVEFLRKRIAADPDRHKLYFLKLEILLRLPDKIDRVQPVAIETAKRFSRKPEILNELNWFILDRLPFGLVPVELMLKLTSDVLGLLPSDAPPPAIASALAARARALFFIGETAAAVELQRQATKMFADNQPAASRMQMNLEVMETALRLRGSNAAQ